MVRSSRTGKIDFAMAKARPCMLYNLVIYLLCVVDVFLYFPWHLHFKFMMIRSAVVRVTTLQTCGRIMVHWPWYNLSRGRKVAKNGILGRGWVILNRPLILYAAQFSDFSKGMFEWVRAYILRYLWNFQLADKKMARDFKKCENFRELLMFGWLFPSELLWSGEFPFNTGTCCDESGKGHGSMVSRSVLSCNFYTWWM